ncbi:MAG TPA: PspC domain-containing protein [Gemmataceae bacterium]
MSLAEELERLHALRQRGALNDDEYALAKAKLLYQEFPEPGTRAPARPEPAAAADQPSEWWSRFWEPFRRLRRSKRDAVIGGVCAGLGEYTAVPTWVWRVIFAAAALLWGFGVVVYLVMWAFVPEEESVTV